tara:strand:- start:24465 stop:24923 length:459 start_codon:yes stop_codon:yes gene_type:complete
MNYAIIKSGGKQYKVSTGDVILVEKILGESGSKVTFDNIIMMGEGKTIHLEASDLTSANVIGEVIEQTRGPKIIVFKKKRRHNYRRKHGHKQDLTAVRIESINLKKGNTTKKNTKKEEPKEAKTIAKKVADKAKNDVKTVKKATTKKTTKKE